MNSILTSGSHFIPYKMMNVDGHTDVCNPESFLVDGTKSRVRLSTTHLIIDNPPSTRFCFGAKKPLEIPIRHLVTLKTTSSSSKKNKFLIFDAHLRFRCWILRARQTVYDRSVRYEAQSADDRFWTPNSKEFYSWQTNINRGDTLVLTYMVTHGQNWNLDTITLKHSSEDVVANWSNLLGCALDKSSLHRPKNLLVFINPYGGKGDAKTIFENTVVPLLRLAGIKYKVVITERANHARDLLRTDPLEGIDGVVCVGGDGMFSELFNGLLLRSIDNRENQEVDQDSEIEAPKIRVGFIPGGSTNAIALSLHGTTDVVTAVLHIILGDRRNIDVSSVRSHDNKLYRFFKAMISYGYFGDLMVHSERLRWLGPKRYDISGVHTFLSNKAYKGSVQFLEETNPILRTDPRRINEACYANCGQCETAGKVAVDGLESEVVSKTVHGNFMVVTGAVMICACHKTPRGVTPSAHLGDGQMDLILVKKTSRLNYFRYLYRTGYLNQSPFELPFVEVHRVREFSFTPNLDENSDDVRKSVWNCDGEVLEDPKIRVKVHCQILPVFARGLERPHMASS